MLVIELVTDIIASFIDMKKKSNKTSNIQIKFSKLPNRAGLNKYSLKEKSNDLQLFPSYSALQSICSLTD